MKRCIFHVRFIDCPFKTVDLISPSSVIVAHNLTKKKKDLIHKAILQPTTMRKRKKKTKWYNTLIQYNFEKKKILMYRPVELRYYHVKEEVTPPFDYGK